jgi:hypothetical protein
VKWRNGEMAKKNRISLFRYFTISPSDFVGGGGFEPPKAAPTDLQSAPFDRSGIPPACKSGGELLIFIQ